MTTAVIDPGVYTIHNIGAKTFVALANDSDTPGTKIQCNAKWEFSSPWVSSQLWIIYQVDESKNAYKIRNAGSRTYMDLTDGNSANQTPIVGNPDNGNDSQEWVITPNTDNTAYVIQNVASKTYVDLYKGNAEDGTPVNGWGGSGPSTSNTHQLWLIERA